MHFILIGPIGIILLFMLLNCIPDVVYAVLGCVILVCLALVFAHPQGAGTAANAMALLSILGMTAVAGGVMLLWEALNRKIDSGWRLPEFDAKWAIWRRWLVASDFAPIDPASAPRPPKS